MKWISTWWRSRPMDKPAARCWRPHAMSSIPRGLPPVISLRLSPIDRGRLKSGRGAATANGNVRSSRRPTSARLGRRRSPRSHFLRMARRSPINAARMAHSRSGFHLLRGEPRFASFPTEEPGRPWRDAPTWSPDGEWIAYLRNLAGRPSLAKTRIGTGETVELMEAPLLFSRPAWSPDGKWIACQSVDNLVRVPAEGGKPVQITDAPILAMTWRADSRRLAILTESETPGHFALAEVDAASGDLRMLNPDLGSIPVANQPIRGFSLAASQGFLTSLASARSDIWILEGLRSPRGRLSTLFSRGSQP